MLIFEKITSLMWLSVVNAIEAAVSALKLFATPDPSTFVTPEALVEMWSAVKRTLAGRSVCSEEKKLENAT